MGELSSIPTVENQPTQHNQLTSIISSLIKTMEIYSFLQAARKPSQSSERSVDIETNDLQQCFHTHLRDLYVGK